MNNNITNKKVAMATYSVIYDATWKITNDAQYVATLNTIWGLTGRALLNTIHGATYNFLDNL